MRSLWDWRSRGTKHWEESKRKICNESKDLIGLGKVIYVEKENSIELT